MQEQGISRSTGHCVTFGPRRSRKRTSSPDFVYVGDLRGQSSSLVRCLIAARKKKKKPWCSILHVSGKYVKTLKGPVGSLVSITQETQILFQCMLKLVSEGESTTLTNTPHESYRAPSVEDGAWSLVEGCLRNYIHGCCIRNVSKKNLR